MLKKSKNLCVDRCYFVRDIKDPVQYSILHGFADASNNAYGAVIYLQTITRSGNVNLSFVTAKSRVTPLKGKFTIHRLELLGNLVSSNLIRAVNSALIEEVKIHDYFCWTDSMVTLGWIRDTKQEFKTFVQNRLIKIRENVSPKK